MPESKKPILVLVDFDGTLMEDDIFLTFIVYRLKEFRFLIKALLASPYLLAYIFKLMDNSKAKEKVFGILFGGEHELDFKRKVEDFWHFNGTEINPAIVDRISAYQKEGAEIMIVSANFAPLVSAFVERVYRINDYLSTEIEVIDGKLSGKFASPNCYGEEKVRRLNIRIHDRKVYSEIHAYGDSEGDRPMLEWADHGFLLQKERIKEI